MTERPATTHLRCPKCRSKNLVLTESGTWIIEWTVTDGRFFRDEAFHDNVSVDRIYAGCRDCEHGWKPRKAHMIDDVSVED
jgi:hypothetical protein